MSADLQRVFEIFREVVELDPAERTAALERRCGADIALRERIERMLLEDSREEVPLDRPLGIPLASLRDEIDHASGISHPTRVAGYAIEGVIDTGGMGTVYAATQANPKRTVALKTIRTGLGSESMLKRFRLEAEVLGSLQHQGIARVYESGIHSEGDRRIPFIAMEFVAGARSLVRYVREEGLGRRERIELFLEVCDAVQYGHQRGIIHRDLKPSNLLVDETGTVKVIDFGLARVLDPEAYALTMAETGSGQMIGTLQYMSPEQVGDSEAAADIRFDVYSLGVVLFELLADRFPYDIDGLNLAGMARAIAEREPLRLARVRPELSGDLDWIVGRAIEKERDRRYPSLSEFAADLRRHLRNEPVSVGPPSGWYRLSKFARRHRWQVGAAAVLALAIGAGTASTLWQNAQARENLEARNLQLEIAGEAYGFLQRVFRSVRPEIAQGDEVTAREILDQARRELERTPLTNAAVEAEVRRNLGETYGALGEFATAAEELERSLKLHREVYGAEDPRTMETEISLLFDRIELGESSAVEQRAATILHILEKQPHADPAQVVTAEVAYGAALQENGHLGEADAVLLRAIARAEAALGENDELTWGCRQARVSVLADAGRFEEAVALKKDIYERRASRLDELDPLALRDGLEFASMLANAGRVEEAEAYWDDLLPRFERVLGPDHPNCLYHRSFRAWCLARAGMREAASKQLSAVLAAYQRAQGSEVIEHVEGMIHAAESLTDLGRLDDAFDLYFAGLEAQTRLSDTPTLTTYRLMQGLGAVLMRRGELQDAEAMFVEAEEGALELLGDHWLTFQLRSNLGGLYYAQGRTVDARPLIESVVAFHEKTAGPDDPFLTLLARSNYGVLLRKMGELEQAEEILTDVLVRRQRVLPEGHRDTLLSLQEIANLARAYEDDGRLDRADALRERVATRE